MPFFLMNVTYTGQKELPEGSQRPSTLTEIDSIKAARWQRGILGTTIELTNLYQKSTDELTALILPLLELADSCTLVAEAGATDVDVVNDVCEALGYHLPLAETALELSQLTDILNVSDTPVSLVDVTSADEDGSSAGASGPSAATTITDLTDWLNTLFSHTSALPYVTLQHLASLAHLFNHAMGTWFDESAEYKMLTSLQMVPDGCDVIDQLAFSKPASKEKNALKAEDEVVASTGAAKDTHSELEANTTALLGADSPFAHVLPGFQVRPGQLQMLDAVADALTDGHHLLVEAGTGTGKSLAYLIPAALHAKGNQDKVIVSTHTIALQDQVSHRDFPLLQRSLGTPVSLSVFKGRTHYLCMRKLHQELRSVTLVTPPEEVVTYMQLLVWLTQTPEGNREELAGKPALSSVWPRIQSETETCINKRCPFFKPCYYFRARARAQEADVVVTNHSLIFTDLKANHRVLPHYNRLIFDEAHHIEQEATRHLGTEVQRFQCLSLTSRLTRDNGKHGVLADLMSRLAGSDAASVKALPTLEQLSDEVLGLRTLIEHTFAGLAMLVAQGQSDFRITDKTTQSPAFSGIAKNGEVLLERTAVVEDLAGQLSETAESEADEDLSGRLFDAVGFLSELVGQAQLLASAGSASADWVEWVEVSGNHDRRQIVYHRAPIDVSKILRERLFEAKDSVVLTSATLSVAGDFSFLKQKLGLTAISKQSEPTFEVTSLTVPSPFDYSRQALLCVPTDVPDLSKMSAEDASVWLSDSIYQLARISQGRLLTLFTSHAMLRATAEYLRRPLADRGLRLLAQGMDGNRTQLLRLFQEEPRSVLLGAQSFWEGIDLPGDQLTTLCIVRLPFSPPTHPVTEARNERLEAQGKSAFWHNSLPEAVVRFRQGFGRLIRTVDDKGVVVVFDKRVVTARYGQQFIQSVPNLRTFVGSELDVLRTVKSFLA
ncbi:helicase C-terminal domain-containing protein [Alicyclobacillus ferrooxydans]|uniref:helicase C-terminal domain-containing protein n=1 Tax=Alicyclobacillus ferrooxydans TaxID=471514 RepID=UPI0006D56216|nr:helicase C-terminal domain-containing protein [Alicyclobacillus ferrooxydans]